MHFSGDISLGNLLTVITLLGIAIRLGWTAGMIEKTIALHAIRLDRYEQALITIISDVQRLVGRVEGVQDRLDKKE